MKILVDADACPVKNEIVRLARKYKLDVFMFCDTSHIINDGYSKTVVVDKGRDSVDIKLVNHIIKGDIVVTQDYGVATMSLSKGAKCLNQNGLIYNEQNIDRLLFERHLSQELRRQGRKNSKNKKRTQQDNLKFEKTLQMLIEDVVINEQH